MDNNTNDDGRDFDATNEATVAEDTMTDGRDFDATNEATVAEDTMTDGRDEETPTEERAIPRPPDAPTSRKRPCRKQGGRKHERRTGDGTRRPMQRKLNQYALDPITGLIVSVRPGQEIPKGSRVVEQPGGNPKPGIAAFYDLSLLPKGSTIVARWGDVAPEISSDLVARASGLARQAGFGDTARRRMRDQFDRSANPVAAYEAFILEIGGTEALSVAPGTLTTTATRDTVEEAIARAVNTANEKLVEMSDNLPVRLTPAKRLVDALADLPGRVVALDADGNGSIMSVRGIRSDQKAVICQKLRDAGGYRIDVKNTKVEINGDMVRAYIVTARFNAAPIELAAAKTDTKAEVTYGVDEDGAVNARYTVDLYGKTVSTASIPCEPSWASVEVLVDELARRGDQRTRELLSQIAVGFEFPAQILATAIGPVRTLEQARVALERIEAADILGDGYAENVAKAAREVRATDGRRIPVEYRGGFAVLSEFSFHPADIRPHLLPESVAVGEEDVPTRVRRVRFEKGRNGDRLRVVVDEVEVSELNERRATPREGRDPRKEVITAVRENFIAETTRSMTAALLTEPETRADARQASEHERKLRNKVLSKHLSSYSVPGGEIVRLVEILAAEQGDVAWVRWCRDYVKAFRDDAYNRRQRQQDPAEDFFVGAGLTQSDKNLLVMAGTAFLSGRLGRDVATDEFLAVAAEAQVTKEHAYTAIDRGKALARYIKRNG
jgi:hypothetical protein